MFQWLQISVGITRNKKTNVIAVECRTLSQSTKESWTRQTQLWSADTISLQQNYISNLDMEDMKVVTYPGERTSLALINAYH